MTKYLCSFCQLELKLNWELLYFCSHCNDGKKYYLDKIRDKDNYEIFELVEVKDR